MDHSHVLQAARAPQDGLGLSEQSGQVESSTPAPVCPGSWRVLMINLEEDQAKCERGQGCHEAESPRLLWLPGRMWGSCRSWVSPCMALVHQAARAGSTCCVHMSSGLSRCENLCFSMCPQEGLLVQGWAPAHLFPRQCPGALGPLMSVMWGHRTCYERRKCLDVASWAIETFSQTFRKLQVFKENV